MPRNIWEAQVGLHVLRQHKDTELVDREEDFIWEELGMNLIKIYCFNFSKNYSKKKKED